MGGKQHKRNPIEDWVREVVPPAGVEVQVYRRLQDNPKKWEYLGTLEPESQVELDSLEAADRDELLDRIPFTETKRRWGGGEYQFRFFWRDDEGRKEPKPRRTRDMGIDGDPIPRR